MIAHRRKKGKVLYLVLIGGIVGLLGVSPLFAANISEFVNIRPYADIEGGYDDNIFELSEDAPLPEDAESREDSYWAARAGLTTDITLERKFLNLGLGLTYDYTYKKYSNNSDLDDGDHYVDFDFAIASQYESKGFFNDRVQFDIKNLLSYIPIVEERPLLPGNRTWKNVFDTGLSYNFISRPRTAFILGYSYNRVDYGDDPISDWFLGNDDISSADLTQPSQSHEGRADFKHAFNSKLIYVLNYAYSFTTRDSDPGVFESADFTRQNVETGVEAKLTPRIHSNLKVGYSMTSYEDVGDASQEDQDSVTGEVSVTGNFNHRPLMTLGYKRYYTENDFGDTLLTDDVFARVGFKIGQGFIVNVTGDYILEDRALYNDDSTRGLLGIDTEYELVKNLKLLVAYNYQHRTFFQHDIIVRSDVEETTNQFSGGLEYKISRYFLLKGLYYYTDKSSDVDIQNYSQNRFVASGRVIF